jgi:hypothetical protein
LPSGAVDKKCGACNRKGGSHPLSSPGADMLRAAQPVGKERPMLVEPYSCARVPVILNHAPATTQLTAG